MQFTSVQWNIGGGFIRAKHAKADAWESYTEEDIDYFINILRKLNPDIITLQEVHADETSSQADMIARELELDYVCTDAYDDSHIVKGPKLCQAVISRYPIKKNEFTLFHNPKFTMEGPDGKPWTSHDKGMTTCIINIDGHDVCVQTQHMIPFRKFGVDALQDPRAQQVRSDITALVDQTHEFALWQGDFNFDGETIRPLLPDAFTAGTNEVPLTCPTTPKGRRYDHIIYRGLHLESSDIKQDVLTDHFPIIATFSL